MSDNPDTKAVLEREAVGNAAAMREALNRLLNLAYEVQDANSECEYGPKTSVPEQFIIDVAKSALSAPPRNCDVGTAEEQAKRLYEWCSGCHCVNCQFKGGWPDECKLEWAQMLYEEGGK